MRPIQDKERQLLKTFFYIDLPAYCWNECGFVFQFTQDRVKVGLGRLTTNKAQQILFTPNKNKPLDNPLPHGALSLNYKSKIANSVDKIKEVIQKYPEYRIMLMDSTGKDSRSCRYVLDKAGIKYETLFVNTSLDVHDTYKMIKPVADIILSPNEGFYQWVKHDIVPTRSIRKCCDIFKEGQTEEHFDDNEKILFISGMRNAESKNRSEYTLEMVNSKWSNTQKENWKLINPIIDWEDIDVWAVIFNEGVEVNPQYAYGYERVGCAIACPYLQTYRMVLDKILYPTYFYKWRKILRQKFIEEKLWVALNCTIDEYCWDGWKMGMKYRDEPTREVINEFARYQNLNYDIAEKYFNQTCVNNCIGKKNKVRRLNKIEVALNLKLFGRSVEKYYCMDCLMKELGVTKAQIKNMIEGFKSQNCSLF